MCLAGPIIGLPFAVAVPHAYSAGDAATHSFLQETLLVCQVSLLSSKEAQDRSIIGPQQHYRCLGRRSERRERMAVIEEPAAVVGLSGRILKPWQKKTNRAPDCLIEINILLLSTGVPRRNRNAENKSLTPSI